MLSAGKNLSTSSPNLWVRELDGTFQITQAHFSCMTDGRKGRPQAEGTRQGVDHPWAPQVSSIHKYSLSSREQSCVILVSIIHGSGTSLQGSLQEAQVFPVLSAWGTLRQEWEHRQTATLWEAAAQVARERLGLRLRVSH